MLEYIIGNVKEKTPTFIVLENQGIGYFINISLNTFTQVGELKEIKLFIHEIIREDTHDLFGFFEYNEREIYRKLISVSGVGPNTARVMISSLTHDEIYYAITNGDVNTIKGVKGIGAKTAQRIIVDLKDRLSKSADNVNIFAEEGNTIKDEALSALIMLGFNKKQAEKVVDKLVRDESELSVEEIVKASLKLL
jgi:Holliday junction DNA helicase RuvA